MRTRAAAIFLAAVAGWAPGAAGAHEDAPEAARSPAPKSDAAPLYGFQFNCLTSLAAWDRAPRGEPYVLNEPPNVVVRIWDSCVLMPEAEGTRDEGIYIGDQDHSLFYRVADLTAKDPRAGVVAAPEASPTPGTNATGTPHGKTYKLSWWTGENTYYNFELEKAGDHWRVVNAYGPSGEARPDHVPIQGRKNDPFLKAKGVARERDFRENFSLRMAIYVKLLTEKVKMMMFSGGKSNREKAVALFTFKATMKECLRLSQPEMEKAAADGLTQAMAFEKSL